MTMTLMLCEYATFVADAIPGLRPIEDFLPPTYWERHGGSILSGCLLVLAAGALVMRLRCRARLSESPSPLETAIQTLREIEAKPENGLMVGAVVRVLRQYFAAVVPAWPPGELTADEMVLRLNIEALLTPELKGEISLLIRQCERRQFLTARSSTSGRFAARALVLLGRIEVERAGSKSPEEARPKTLQSIAKTTPSRGDSAERAEIPTRRP